MDKRILSLGKFNISKNDDSRMDNRVLSECYFDWIRLEKIEDSPEVFTAEALFSHEEFQKDVISLEHGSDHTQESMILVSDAEDDFLLSPRRVFVSMINLPMWNESAFCDGSEYVAVREIIFRKISEITGEGCKLYHTFDHCDLILLADGDRISFPDYIEKIKALRDLEVEVNGTKLRGILDITSIYGYTKNHMESPSFPNERINFVLELSFQNPEYKNILIRKLQTLPDVDIDIVGRYDTLMLWKNKPASVFNEVVSVLRNDLQFLFTYRIIIGCDTEKNGFLDISKKRPDQRHTDSELTKRAVILFNQINEMLKTDLQLPLYNALVEIQNSIITMLHSGFAQYYTLSFYESYYSFICFIARMYQKSLDVNGYKKVLEKTYDMFRRYFGYLNALNACTIHSERQFLQADSYQLLYYDAAPKLIAFYTAVANKIVSVIERETDNHYTFLITPDFKDDIFVESLTEDRTFGKERNILIIHVDEDSLYSVSDTVKIITHEIFHHIGQKTELRRYRAGLFIKIALAYILAHCVPGEVFIVRDSPHRNYELFRQMVEAFYSAFFNHAVSKKGERFFLLTDNEEKGYSADQEAHYLENLVTSFISEMKTLFEDRDFQRVADLLNKLIKEPNELFFELFSCEAAGSDDAVTDKIEKMVLTELSNDTLAEEIAANIHNWLADHHEIMSYDIVRKTLRESFADFSMVNLVCADEDKKSFEYLSMMFQSGEIIKEEYPRIYAVLKALDGDAHPWVKDFRDHTLYSTETALPGESASDDDNGEDSTIFDSNYGLFYYYLGENTAEYLAHCKQNFEDIKDVDQLKETLSSMIRSFNKSSVQEIVNIIDREVFEYRQRLIEEQKRTSLF